MDFLKRMQNFDFYIEQLSVDLNSYELKMFRVQHDEIQFSTYSDTNNSLNMQNLIMMKAADFCIFH